MRNYSKNKANCLKRGKTRENTGDQVAIGFSFESDWSRKWREFSDHLQSKIKQYNMERVLFFFTSLSKLSRSQNNMENAIRTLSNRILSMNGNHLKAFAVSYEQDSIKISLKSRATNMEASV